MVEYRIFLQGASVDISVDMLAVKIADRRLMYPCRAAGHMVLQNVTFTSAIIQVLSINPIMNALPVNEYLCDAQRTLGSPGGKHC